MTTVSDPKPQSVTAVLRDRWPTLGILVIAAYFALAATTFPNTAGRFPLIIAVFTLVAGLIDLALAIRTRGAAKPPAPAPCDQHARLEWFAWIWFLGSVAALYVLGIVIAAGLSTAGYYCVRMRIGIFRSVIAGAVTAAVFHLVFQVLAGFRLYTGVF